MREDPRDPFENSGDPLAAIDFAEIDEIMETGEDWESVGSEDSTDSEEMTEDEAYEADPFVSNAAQALFRERCRSGLFDTMMAAGTISSGKTYGIAALIVEMCLEYPETVAMVVRTKRESLEDSTIPDFLSVLAPADMRSFNKSKLDLRLRNGSLIQFRSANEQADPKFIWLRGKKFDIGFIDECDGVSREFVSAFQSRVGIQRRRSRRSYKVCPPVTFFACNPNMAWPKEYYSLATHSPKKLLDQRFYFQKVTVEDNAAFITEAKKAQWKKVMPGPMYKRFVGGSWDAMADLEQLFLFEDMDRCARIIPPPDIPAYRDDDGVDHPARPGKWENYLGVDPAGYGADKCTFLVMNGPNFYRLDFRRETSVPEIYLHVKRLMAEFNISPDHVTIDADGLGAGVVDMLGAEHIWVNAHKGSAAPDDAAFYWTDPTDVKSRIEMDNAAFSFHNKRAQAHWEAMQMMRAGKIGGFNPEVLGWKAPADSVGDDEINMDETLRQDMAAIHYGFHKGTKAIQIEDKAEIKKRLHRSPDFSDVAVNAIQAYLHDTKKPSMEVFSA